MRIGDCPQFTDGAPSAECAGGAPLADDLATLTVTETPEASVTLAAQDATDGPETSVPAGEKDLPPAVVTEAQTDVSDAPEAPATETEIEMPVIGLAPTRA